jgi:hypothetical protein
MNLKTNLFEFRNGLNSDQYDIHDIVTAHFNVCESYSEKEIMASLNHKLSAYAYYPNVKGFLENANEEIEQEDLLYTLKDVYAKLERENDGNFMKAPMDALMDAINAENDEERLNKVLNDVAVYDWVPQIKALILSLSTSDMDKANLTSKGGVCEDIFTIAADSKDGKLAYINNAWFIFKDGEISITTLEQHIEDQSEIEKLRLLETAIDLGTITKDNIDFKLDTNVSLSISTKTKNKYTINGEEVESNTSLEDLFQMPIIAMTMANCYQVVKAVCDNPSNFVNLDVATMVTNISMPTKVIYAIKHDGLCYTYTVDSRYGNMLVSHDTASAVIELGMSEMEADLSFFYSDMLSKEDKERKKLEKAEDIVTESIANLDEALDLLEAEKLAGTADETIIESAIAETVAMKESLVSKLQTIKLKKVAFFNQAIA